MLMEKRHLNDNEMTMVRRNIKLIEEDLEYQQALLKEKSVLIEIAPLKYKHQLENMKSEEKSLRDTVKEHENAVKILNDQLRNGVEIKTEDDKKSK